MAITFKRAEKINDKPERVEKHLMVGILEKVLKVRKSLTLKMKK